MSNTAKKLETLTAKEATQLGIEAANLKHKGDAACTAELLRVAQDMTERSLSHYIEGLKARFEALEYATPGSMASRYKGAMLYVMGYRGKQDLSVYTVTELYNMAKESKSTDNKRGSGNKRKTAAQQLHSEMEKLVKKFGKAKVKAELKKL